MESQSENNAALVTGLGIKVKWREIGWNALIEEFAPSGIGAELLEVEA